jgi:hypothetical protein
MRFDREMDSKVDSKRAGEFWFQTGMLAVHFTVHPTAVTNISQCKVCAKNPLPTFPRSCVAVSNEHKKVLRGHYRGLNAIVPSVFRS